MRLEGGVHPNGVCVPWVPTAGGVAGNFCVGPTCAPNLCCRELLCGANLRAQFVLQGTFVWGRLARPICVAGNFCVGPTCTPKSAGCSSACAARSKSRRAACPWQAEETPLRLPQPDMPPALRPTCLNADTDASAPLPSTTTPVLPAPALRPTTPSPAPPASTVRTPWGCRAPPPFSHHTSSHCSLWRSRPRSTPITGSPAHMVGHARRARVATACARVHAHP